MPFCPPSVRAILTVAPSGGTLVDVDEEYDDATLALLALFDIRRDVARIAEALADGEEEEEDNEDA